IRVPGPGEVPSLTCQFLNLLDERITFDPFHQRVFGRSAELFGKSEIAVGAEVLVAEKDHQMIEQGLPEHLQGLAVEIPADIHSADFCAQSTCDGGYGDRIHV